MPKEVKIPNFDRLLRWWGVDIVLPEDYWGGCPEGSGVVGTMYKYLTYIQAVHKSETRRTHGRNLARKGTPC
eukprot:1845177-Amphidinium_carterae.1